MREERRSASEELFATERKMKDFLKPYFLEIGLTLGQGQPRILKNLLKKDHVTQKELADICHLDVTTMSRTLDKLEQKGWLCRKRDENCRRSYRIILTEAGREKAREVVKGMLFRDEAAWKGFDRQEMETMFGYLKRIAENLEEADCQNLTNSGL